MKLTYKDEDELRDYLNGLKAKHGTDWREWYHKLREQGIYLFLRNGKSIMIEKLEKIMEGGE